jgi:dTDP-4-amino-4,6-dideoxygalactose transaminase
MTNIQAALGVAQLEQLESFISVKAENFRLYKSSINKKLNGFKNIGFPERYSAELLVLFPVYFRFKKILKKQDNRPFD